MYFWLYPECTFGYTQSVLLVILRVYFWLYSECTFGYTQSVLLVILNLVIGSGKGLSPDVTKPLPEIFILEDVSLNGN